MTRETFELTDGEPTKAVIRVIGVGGAGCNTVNQMAKAGITGVEFICANTDRDHLEKMVTNHQIQLGSAITRGLGAGSDPSVGRQAAEEDRDRIREMLDGTDLLFIAAGMGGGTGTGAAPVIAEIAKSMKILTVAVVSKPFPHEGAKRMKLAEEGIRQLESMVDSLILIPNEKLRLVLGGQMTLQNCFKCANDVLQNAVKGIADLITRPGEMNVDFADVRTVMGNQGMAMMGIGSASGEGRALTAIQQALSSPLLDDLELSGARGILVNICCDESLSLEEWETIADTINKIASPDADAKIGTAIDTSLNGELVVTVVATGLSPARKPMPEVSSNVKPVNFGDKGALPSRTLPIRQPSAMVAPMTAPLVRSENKATSFAYDEKILDIPTFLRQQAD